MTNHRTIAMLLILATVHCAGPEVWQDAATDATTDGADGGVCNVLVPGSFVSPYSYDGTRLSLGGSDTEVLVYVQRP